MRASMRKKTMCLSCLVYLAVGCPVAAQEPEIATTVSFTEGPTVDRDGNVARLQREERDVAPLGEAWKVSRESVVEG